MLKFHTKRVVLGTLALILMSLAANAQSGKNSGTFAWFDLATNNTTVARDFYKGLFGWRFSRNRSAEYWTIKSNGTELGGLFSVALGDGEITYSQWIAVIAVDDAIDATRNAVTRGAHQVGKPVQTEDGTFSAIRDPAGAVVDLYSGPLAFDTGAAGRVGSWAWADHFSPSPGKVANFYGQMFGHKQGRQADGSRVLTQNGAEVGGLVYVPRTQIEPNWLPYVAVADVENSAAKALELGGGILAIEDDGAILLDPTGAAIGIVQAGG